MTRVYNVLQENLHKLTDYNDKDVSSWYREFLVTG